MRRSTVGTRLGWVDAVRGVAIVLMVIDHVLYQVDPGSWLRFTLTRAALPMFLVASAMVWRGRPSTRRLAELTAAAVLEVGLLYVLAMPQPGIVALMLWLVLVLWALPIIQQKPGLFGALGLIQALYLPAPWLGYQPGLVLAWWCLGALAGRELEPFGRRMPTWVQAIGRRPLAWYLGHLALLAVLVIYI